MWNNIGRRLQSLAKVLCWLGIIGSVIRAVVLWTQNSYYQPTILSGILFLFLGCLASWIGSWALYGLGLVVACVENSGKLSPPSGGPDAGAETEEAEKTKGTKLEWYQYNEEYVKCPQCEKWMNIKYVEEKGECIHCGFKYTLMRDSADRGSGGPHA